MKTPSPFQRVETLHPKIPWLWVPFICLPWVATEYVERCSDLPLTFTIRKFTEDPGLISLISSVNILFNFMVGAVASFLSDRIWTPIGRRRPFLILGWTGVALMMFFLPVVDSLGAFMVVVILYQFFQDVAKPVEPLFNEVIPQPQRGRASVIRQWMTKALQFVFSGLLIAQYDHQYRIPLGGAELQFGGDQVIFWIGSAVLIGVALSMLFGVRERPPLHRPPPIKVNPLVFFKDIFGDRQSLMIYVLWLAPWMTTIVARTFIPLFQTEQLGFSKAQIGAMFAITLPLDVLLFTVAAGFLADRVNRLRLLQLGVLLPGLVNFVLFLLVRYVTDYQLSFGALVGFNIVYWMFLSLMFVVWGPILFDYIPSNRFGTIAAGLSIVNGILGFLLMNLGGQWVAFVTRVFGTRGSAPNDYSSIFVLGFIVSLIALGLLIFFEREVRAGRVIPYAAKELEEEKQRELRERSAAQDEAP